MALAMIGEKRLMKNYVDAAKAARKPLIATPTRYAVQWTVDGTAFEHGNLMSRSSKVATCKT